MTDTHLIPHSNNGDVFMNEQQSHILPRRSDDGILDGLVKPLVENLLERNGRLERLVETGFGRHVDTGDELSQARTRVEKAEAELIQARSDHDELLVVYESASREITGLRKEMAEQKKILAGVRKKLKAKAAEHTEAVRQIHELRAELEEKANQPTRLEADPRLIADLRQANARVADLETELKRARDHGAKLEDEVANVRLALKKANSVEKKASPKTASAVNLASVKRHLNSARRLFDEDPDKSLISLDRAISLCGTEKETESKEESDDERAA